MLKFAQRLRKMQKEESGFTLIELMVVVVIIGILAAVAVPKITGIVYQSKVNADVATGKTVQDAVDRFMQNNTTTPSTATLSSDLLNGAGGPYLNGSALPKSQQDQSQIGTTASGAPIEYDPATASVKVFNNINSGHTQVWPAN